jgi:hypothetical protein
MGRFMLCMMVQFMNPFELLHHNYLQMDDQIHKLILYENKE